VREVPDGSEKLLLELALVENIQRENLNAIDEAVAYKRLADQFGLTQEQIAVAVGKDRASVANILRLLKLPEDVRQQISGGALSMGQARAILSLESPALQRQAASEAIARGLSVRETEALVKRLASASAEPGEASKAIEKDVHTRAAEDRMRFALGAKVIIHRKSKGGAIEIGFDSEDELNRLFEFITARR
jgi:ParB family chromosome partitioning protein